MFVQLHLRDCVVKAGHMCKNSAFALRRLELCCSCCYLGCGAGAVTHVQSSAGCAHAAGSVLKLFIAADGALKLRYRMLHHTQ